MPDNNRYCVRNLILLLGAPAMSFPTLHACLGDRSQRPSNELMSRARRIGAVYDQWNILSKANYLQLAQMKM